MTKFGNIKRQHGRIEGLDAILDRLVHECPHVTRIVPGRISRKRGKNAAEFKVQYATHPNGDSSKAPNGLKCIYSKGGACQEVFLSSEKPGHVMVWIHRNLP